MEIEYDIELSERKKMILKAIVEAHIKLGEPVGSKYLTQEMGISYSSATIRNEMAELEEMGFLEQPHTSAGRIPSELGYRFYVDSLVQQYDMTTKEANELNNMLSVKMSEIDKILENARKAASAMTNYTALTLRSSPTNVTVKKYEVVFLESRNILLVMVTVNDSVKTRNIKLPFDVSREDTERLSFVLNEELSGIATEDINISLIVRMEERMASCPGIVNIVVKSIYETMNEISSEIRFEGVNRLLQYPEYKNLDKLQQMISTIEDKNDIIRVGDLSLDLKKVEAKVKGEVINLTKKEFDVLKYLASQPGQVVTREMLLREVWEYEEYVGAIRTIDVTMNRIRDKIEKDKANPKILITKRGVGYYVTDKN